jgi:hypothetical protein
MNVNITNKVELAGFYQLITLEEQSESWGWNVNGFERASLWMMLPNHHVKKAAALHGYCQVYKRKNEGR